MPPLTEESRFAKRLLQSKRILTVKEWQGELRVDIREWDGFNPTKKGVSLTLSRWKVLFSYIPEIRQCMKNVSEGRKDKTEFKRESGGNVFVSYMKNGFPFVDIRQYWLPENQEELVPTTTGMQPKPLKNFQLNVT